MHFESLIGTVKSLSGFYRAADPPDFGVLQKMSSEAF
jgi:hypothetical protein